MLSKSPVVETRKDRAHKTDRTDNSISIKKIIPKSNHDYLGHEPVEFCTFMKKNYSYGWCFYSAVCCGVCLKRPFRNIKFLI